jgi:putative addiction module component (TIGR02574 family)
MSVLMNEAMTPEASRLLEEALHLNVDDRARMAAELLASLDEEQEDVRAAWAAEITRRLSEADAEPEGDEDWRTAIDEIRPEVLSR